MISIWPIDRTLIGSITSGQSGPATEIQFQQWSKIEDNFFDLYFDNSNSDSKSNRFDWPWKHSPILMWLLGTISAMLFDCMWTKVYQNIRNSEYGGGGLTF